MYPVSAAYKAASRAQIREAQAHARIYMGVFDATASPDATLTYPAKTKYSTPANVNADASITASYATFEPDRVRLDGKHILLPDSNQYVTQGLVTATQSGADGTFPTPPEIVITFGVQHTLVGLTLTFDPVDPPPAQLTLLAYTGDTLASTTTITAISNPLQWELLLTDVDKLVLRFDKTANPQGRARLNRVEFGIGYSFQDRDIIELTEKHTDAPVSTTLPSSSLSFALDNSGGQYNVDGDTALVRFLTAGQRVNLTYGMDADGGVEWIPGGIWQLDSWDVDGIRAKFSCVDAITALTKTTYEKGVYDWQIHYLYDLAVAVFADAGIPASDYYLDPHLRTCYTSAPMTSTSHAAALQLIANRANARIFCNRTGQIAIETLTTNPEYVLLPPSGTSRYTYYSDLSSVIANTSKSYATFEADYTRLDGSVFLLPDGTDKVPNSGMTSKGLSQGNGDFIATEQLVWQANAAKPTNAYSVSLAFGGQIPHTIGITAKIDDKWQPWQFFYPKSNEETFSTGWQHVQAVQVNIIKMPGPDRRGHISAFTVQNATDLIMDHTQIFDRPIGKLLTRLRNVTAQWIWRSYYPTVDVQVASLKATAGQGWMRIEHECCYNPIVTVDSADVTVEQRNYAFVSYAKLTGDTSKEVNLTITGKKLYEAHYPVRSAGYDTGEDLPVDSALYDNSNIQSTLDWMRDYYSRRIEYQSSCRGFPELDMADIITLEDGSMAQITASELTYNGAFRQTLTYRK